MTCDLFSFLFCASVLVTLSQELTLARLHSSFRSLLSRDYTLLSGAYSRETTLFFQELTLTRLHTSFRSLLSRDYTLLSGAYSSETTHFFRSLLSRDYALLSGAYSHETTCFFQELTLTRLRISFRS